jgi:two-component system sensor histidine kinase DegS
VQQACENAVRHAQAQMICVSGWLEPDRVEILIEDDGVGMPGQDTLDFNTLLAKKHFGLAGMFERADLIGAVIQIESAEGAGTKIKIIWSAQESFEPASRMI